MGDGSVESAAKEHLLVRRSFSCIGRLAAILTATASIGLLLVYVLVGDSTVWGEAVTVFPPVLWLIPLFSMAIGVVFARSCKTIALTAGSILAFCLGTIDWLPLLRSKSVSPPGIHSAELRVITWNIAGRSDWQNTLDQFENLKPDVVFLQETPDGENSLTTESLRGYWKNFSWWDQGDCGILSRYKLSPLPSRKIGPWDKPALATIEVSPHSIRRPTTHTLLLCNVRMMMPAAAISGMANWLERERQHEERLRQYIELADLVNGQRKNGTALPAIIGGDFNVRGGSQSLRALSQGGFSDAWPKAGAGWGATFMSDFPVARIDQIWVSEELQPAQSFTIRGTVSDHKMVVTDIKLP